MLGSKHILLSGIAAVALAAPAFAEDRSTTKQREQYIYQQQSDNNLGVGASEGAIGETKANSGPGVQGAPDTRTGPSTKAPGGAADAGTPADASGSASSGASSGEAGTQPSQDASGVQGFPDTRTGPATKSADDSNADAKQ